MGFRRRLLRWRQRSSVPQAEPVVFVYQVEKARFGTVELLESSWALLLSPEEEDWVG